MPMGIDAKTGKKRFYLDRNGTKVRTCIKCYKPFLSPHVSTRVCTTCRKAFKKAQQKVPYLYIYESTDEMSNHMDRKSLDNNPMAKMIDAFLDGDTQADDTEVYQKIHEETGSRILREKQRQDRIKANIAMSTKTLISLIVKKIPKKKTKKREPLIPFG